MHIYFIYIAYIEDLENIKISALHRSASLVINRLFLVFATTEMRMNHFFLNFSVSEWLKEKNEKTAKLTLESESSLLLSFH